MKFAKGFLRNFAVLLVAYLGYTYWQQESYFWSIGLFILAICISIISYKLLQKERQQEQ